MLQETLKQATQQNHNDLEQLMYVHEIMNGTLSLQHYKTIIVTNYLVHQKFEDQLYKGLSPQLAQEIQLDKRHKLLALSADIRELNLDVPVASYVEQVDFEKNDADILGALYVLEGATLGGSVIVKKLKTNPNLVDFNLGYHYYQVYGSELIPRWKSFCEILNKQPADTFDKSVEGAKKMFNYIAATQQKVTAG